MTIPDPTPVEPAPPPELTFPEAEAELVRSEYAKARCILEYGSGGSTWLAATMPNKFILSVESDRAWALNLQRAIDAAGLPSPALVQHVDIGKTGAWGRPESDRDWRKFHHYPTQIWSESYFRQPDLVLIDGRFRPACLVTTCLKTKGNLRVLFDDYMNREAYHVVERMITPVMHVGRMAVFDVEPREWPGWTQDFLIDLCTRYSLAKRKNDYSEES